MKTLELNQMEHVQAGDCTERLVLLGLGLTALTIASIATGFTITGPIFAGIFANSTAAAALVGSGDCF